MSRRDAEEAAFLAAPDREAYLREHSGLPGPRGNLELIDVASAAAGRADLVRWAALDPETAPENTPGVFLACVGIVGLGRLVAAGDRSFLPVLRRSSSDPRWRAREAVAMALQAWGDVDPDALVDEMERWASGSALEGRAAMAALCEPRLLGERETIARTLAILDRLTASVRDAADPRAADVRVLRQALGYGWSVAVAADSSLGVLALEPWLAEPNGDVRWIVRQNLAKARLERAAPGWVEHARATQSWSRAKAGLANASVQGRACAGPRPRDGRYTPPVPPLAAVTPSAITARAPAIVAVFATPVGPVHGAATDEGIVGLELRTTDEAFAASVRSRTRRPVLAVADPAASPLARAHLAALEREVAEHLAGTRDVFSLPVVLEGIGDWDRRVLEGVRTIPRGITASYGEIARRIGSPGAARAVGGAVGRNPVGLLIPCHRVIAGDGTLGGYGGSWFGSREELLRVKERLLEVEGIHVPRRS